MSQERPTEHEIDTYARAFIEAGASDRSRSKAWRATFPNSKASEESVWSMASKFHSFLSVQSRIEELVEEAAKRAEKAFNIKADDIVRMWWDLATADPAELTQVRHGACRHCHGLDHEYHWKDAKEFALAVKRAKDLKAPAPDDFGGYGYRETAKPDPDCPQCEGQGIGRTWIADTRDLSPKARLLYAGVEQTRTGIKVKTRDQDAALANLARWLGMFTDNVNLRSPDGSMTPTVIERVITDPKADDV